MKEKITNWFKTQKGYKVAAALVVLIFLAKSILGYLGVWSLLVGVIAGGILLISPLLMLYLYIPVTFLLTDIPFFFFPVRYVVGIRGIQELNYLKFYTLYALTILSIALWTSGPYIALLTQYLFLSRMFKTLLPEYLLKTSKKKHWHILLFVLFIIGTILRYWSALE